MRKVSVRDLGYRFSAIEDALRHGEEIQITRRKRVVARLLPPEPPAMPEMPDFLGRMKKIFKGKVLKATGAELVPKGAVAIKCLCSEANDVRQRKLACAAAFPDWLQPAKSGFLAFNLSFSPIDG